jgi:hypothetical protein
MLLRRMNVSNVKRYTRQIGGLQVISGNSEGERVVLGDSAKQCVVNVPDMEEMTMLLKEQGARRNEAEETREYFELHVCVRPGK